MFGSVLLEVGAALENFPTHTLKKKFHLGKKKGTHGEGKKNNLQGRLWQKTRIEVVCCYIPHHPTVLSPLSHL
jgi:hypothetical protein